MSKIEWYSSDSSWDLDTFSCLDVDKKTNEACCGKYDGEYVAIENDDPDE